MLSKKKMDIEFDTLAYKLHDFNTQIKVLEDQKEILINTLRSFVNNTSYVTANFVYIKDYRKPSIDYKAIALVFDVEKYRKNEQVEYWTFKKSKE